MKCAYCGKEMSKAMMTREHIISKGVLDLFPECFITFDGSHNKVHLEDPMIKDVCAECNNKRITYIDSYAKEFIGKYFVQKYNENSQVEIQFNYVMMQKMLLKYAFNDLRAHKMDCSFFDEEILHYLLNESDTIPKTYVSVLCGLAVNVSPAPDAFFGNLKLRWVKDPVFFSNSIVNNIDYTTGQYSFQKEMPIQHFSDLLVSYAFRFNSVQFLLMCWDKNSDVIERNNIILSCQYPYHLLEANETTAEVPVCTDEINYQCFEQIHVRWDGLFEIGTMRKLASGGEYHEKELLEKKWVKEEEKLKMQHPRQ